jgi:hypothetical protein
MEIPEGCNDIHIVASLRDFDVHSHMVFYRAATNITSLWDWLNNLGFVAPGLDLPVTPRVESA